MLEVYLVLLFLGLALAARSGLGFGNPFQVYFFVWLFIALAYYSTSDTYIPVTVEFVLLLMVAKLAAFIILFAVYMKYSNFAPFEKRVRNNVKIRRTTLLVLQCAVTIGAPAAYARAIELADGASIFSILGYIRLRSAITADGLGFGVLTYLFVVSIVVASLRTYTLRWTPASIFTFLWAIVASLFYAYMGTGRTFVLILVCACSIPLVISNKISIRALAVVAVITLILFAFMALMTSKGVSADRNLAGNFASASHSLRAYIVAPTLAFSTVVEQGSDLYMGEYSLRFFVALFRALGLTDSTPVALIRDFAHVPDSTNVYTVYEVYFNDFSYLGIAIPPLFLAGHWLLYVRARKRGGFWVFYYAATCYPLLMQFFQDQYFSLLSMWVQMAFWYAVLVSRPNKDKQTQSAPVRSLRASTGQVAP